MSFGFLGLFLAMIASTVFLIYALTKGKKRISDIPAVYESEAKHMTCILIFFLTTYGARFFSDYFAIPYLTNTEHYQTCIIDNTETVCVTNSFIHYYLWTSLIFDLAPIGVIIYFHHRSFRLDMKLRQGSVLSTNQDSNVALPQS